MKTMFFYLEYRYPWEEHSVYGEDVDGGDDAEEELELVDRP